MKKISLIISILLLLAAVVPLFYNVWNAGTIALFVFGILLLLVSLLWAKLHRFIKICLSVFLSLGLLACFIVSGLMVKQGWFSAPPPQSDITVIVLGGRVYEYGPSLMVARRLDAAATYLLNNPSAGCIVSGGQGADEVISEASSMAKYLVDKYNIDPARIVLEDYSTNTLENIRYSKALLGGETDIVIATDPFHQLRASILAKREGLNAYAVSSFTPPGLLPAYWTRDMFGVMLIILLG